MRFEFATGVLSQTTFGVKLKATLHVLKTVARPGSAGAGPAFHLVAMKEIALRFARCAAYVSFRRDRTCLPHWFGQLCAITGLVHCNKAALLFDHLVGEGEQFIRHGEAERLGSFEIEQ